MSQKTRQINPECGRRLKQLVTENGMTQQELANRLHNNKQHISNIICGKRSLTLGTAQQIAGEVFPWVRVEWLLCIDDFKTQAEKDAVSRQAWEDSVQVVAFQDKVFRCFVEGLEDMQGYGIHTGNTDDLLGEYVVITNANGEPVGAIPAESFRNLQSEVENYASYLIQRIIKNEMGPIPRGGKESIDKWLTSKNAGTSPAD